MKVVLFGEDIFTVTALLSLLANQHQVQGVFTPAFKLMAGQKALEQSCRKNDVPFFPVSDINGEGVSKRLLEFQPDIILSVHLRKILSKRIFSLAKNAAVNVHPSLLPKYRGLSPQHQALLHGDQETGVTIHVIEDAVDTGGIIIQEKIQLTPETYIYQLQFAIQALYRTIIPEAIRRLEDKTFRPVPQSVSGASWFDALTESDRRIDLKKAKFEVYNLIRAVSKPYQGAFYQDLIIWQSRLPDLTEESAYEEYKTPGIYQLDEEKLLIRLQDGILLSDDFETAIA